jgi:tRNA pseudouridine38-40 synthase
VKRFKLTIAYDGTDYMGWQRQPEPKKTVQREIEKAAGYILSRPITINGASRTDTGVHAMGQVAAFNADTTLSPEILRKAINSRLPHDILIRTLEETTLDFDVRHAKRKRYRYLIWNHSDRPVHQRHMVYHFYRPLDLAAMQVGCTNYVGTHDFNAFRGQTDPRDNTVRTIFSCTINQRSHGAVQNPTTGYPNDPLIIFAVEGSGFLYHMVRTMVGTLIDVGTGKYSPHRIAEIMASRDREEAGPTAPAQGLSLQWIRF